MMPLYCARKREIRDRIEGVDRLDVAVDFPDDGIDVGDSDVVCRCLGRR